MKEEKIRRDPKEVFDLILKGKNKQEIAKELDLSKTALANHLEKLEVSGHIKREGKFIIKTLRSSYLYPKVTKNRINKKLNKRGHAHNVSVIFSKEEDLRENELVISEFKKGKLKKLGFGSYQLIKKKYTIWINKDSLTIYSNNYFCSDKSLLAKFTALRDIDNLIGDLKRKFNLRGEYGIEVFREHYGLIFNKFAEWILKNGKKVYVKDKGNKTILWVDDSRKDDIGLKELEGKDPIQVDKIDDYCEDVFVKHGAEVNSSFILNGFELTNKNINLAFEGINKNAAHLEFHAENMRSHVGATRDLSGAAKTINTNLEKQNKLFERIAGELERLENAK